MNPSHLPRLPEDAYGDHERVEHLVLFEKPAADVGEHVQAHVVDQNPAAFTLPGTLFQHEEKNSNTRTKRSWSADPSQAGY